MKEATKRPSVQADVMRPGPGWKRLDGVVWEHSTGTRIHLGGMMRFPDGTTLPAYGAKEHERICGWNRKRGLMVWALNMLAHNASLNLSGDEPE